MIFSGTRTPAHDFTSPVIDGYSEDIPGSEVLDFDADEAKKLWAEADAIAPWDGTFQIAYNADGGHQAWVDAVANQLKNNLGIDASGAPYPTFAEVAHRDHRPHRSRPRSAPVGRPTTRPCSTSSARSTRTDAGSNDGDYSNAEFDALLKEGLAETDIDEANEKFQAGAGDPLQGPPRDPAVVLQRSTAHGARRSTTSSSAGTRFRCTTRSPRASNSRSGATRG